MQTRRMVLGLVLALWLVLAPASGSSAATYVWIVLQPPYRPPAAGETFTTEIKIAASGGVVGALEFAVRYDPSLFRVLEFSTPTDSPFYDNCAVDAASYASGRTQIDCFQVDLAEPEEYVVVGALTWQKVGEGGSAADIVLEPGFVVDAAWRPVEVQVASLPKASYSLGPGWNLATLALGPDPDLTARTLLQALGSQSGNVTEIDRWYNSGWDPHVNGLPFNDFPIQLGEGYFIKGQVGSCTQLTGWAPWGGIGFILQPGWNLVGVPFPASGYTAQSLLSGIADQGGACAEIDRWSEGSWAPHIKDLPFNDFEIRPDEGYFVKCTQASGFIPSSLTEQALQASWRPAWQPDPLAGAGAPGIDEVLVTNRRDVSLAVTWQTDGPADGWVEYGESEALGLRAYDDRGGEMAARTHVVTLGRLAPETPYFFRVHSGSTVADDAGVPFRVATRATGGLTTPFAAYGRVVGAGGRPATDALVIARLTGSEGEQPEALSAVVDGWSWWVLDLAVQQCDGIELELQVQGVDGLTGRLKVPACESSPLPAITLGGEQPVRIYLPVLIR